MSGEYVDALKGLIDDFIGYERNPKVTTAAELKKYFRENYQVLNLDINADFSAVVIDAIMMLGGEARLERMELGRFKLLPGQESFVPTFSEQRVCSAYFCNNRAKFVSNQNKKFVYCSKKCFN